VVSTPHPSGDTMPKPVTTTRLMPMLSPTIIRRPLDQLGSFGLKQERAGEKDRSLPGPPYTFADQDFAFA